MASVLKFYSDGPSLNPAKVNSFSVELFLKRTKRLQSRPIISNSSRPIISNSSRPIISNSNPV